MTENLNKLFEIPDLPTFQDESEKLFLTKKLEKNNYNMTKTAREIKVQRSHIYFLTDKHKIGIVRQKKVSNGKYTLIFTPNGLYFNFYIESEPELTTKVLMGLKGLIIRKTNIRYAIQKIFARIEAIV